MNLIAHDTENNKNAKLLLDLMSCACCVLSKEANLGFTLSSRWNDTEEFAQKLSDSQKQNGNINSLGIFLLKRIQSDKQFALIAYHRLMMSIIKSGIIPSELTKLIIILFDEKEITKNEYGESTITFNWIENIHETGYYDLYNNRSYEASQAQISINELQASDYRVIYSETPIITFAEIPSGSIEYSFSSESHDIPNCIDSIDWIKVDMEAPSNNVYQNNRVLFEEVSDIIDNASDQIKNCFGIYDIKDTVECIERLSYGAIAFDNRFRNMIPALESYRKLRRSYTDNFVIRYTQTMEDLEYSYHIIRKLHTGFDILELWKRIFNAYAVTPDRIGIDDEAEYYNGIMLLGKQIGMPQRLKALKSGVAISELVP